MKNPVHDMMLNRNDPNMNNPLIQQPQSTDHTEIVEPPPSIASPSIPYEMPIQEKQI